MKFPWGNYQPKWGSAWRPFGLPELLYEVERFDPSFFFCKFSNKSTLKVHAKSVKSSVFGWRYLDCLWSKFLAKTTVWKLILRTTFFERSYFPQRFCYGPKFETYNQNILYLASRWYEPVDTRGRWAAVKFTSRKSRWIVVTEIVGDGVVTDTFPLVRSSVRTKQLLCFVHGQGQKGEQKHTTKNLSGFW